MNHVNFFKLQSKNLLRDFKTRKKVYDHEIKTQLYEFSPRFFDIDNIILTYNFSDMQIEKFTLMKAQHFIAQLVGFKKWNFLIKASIEELELAKLLFDNQHKLSLDDWEEYIFEIEKMNHASFTPKEQLHIFKNVFLNENSFAAIPNDIRLQLPAKIKNSNKVKKEMITQLPLSESNRKEFINSANSVFETVLIRIDHENPSKIRELWNAEEYIENGLLDKSMLPISKDYALSLIDSFLVHHILGLCSQLESKPSRSNY
ncbi:MAG: hypothetical protein H6621_06525 [Halobacteriovoraceae bacterium]|nr:hypothetical protein [Halobacteriovoraceae bacterium]